MKPLFRALSLLLISLPALAGCVRENPVVDIVIDPRSATLFVGETAAVTVTCFPEDATNTDELLVYSTNEGIITYRDGIVTAVDGGTAAVTASCGDVVTQARFKVYRDKIYKGGEAYGIDYATGYLYMMGQSSFQELEIELVHQPGSGTTQHFRAWLTKEQLGQDLDYTKPLSDTFVGVYANNNEDGYLVYSSSEGTPMIVKADWSYADGVTLRRGILRVDQYPSSRYKVHADFELSSGYKFSTDWEGTANMSVE